VLFAKGGIAGGIDAWRWRKMTPPQLLAALALLARQGLAAAADRWRQCRSLLRRTAGDAVARWKACKMALGRLLVTILLGIAVAVDRWRRR